MVYFYANEKITSQLIHLHKMSQQQPNEIEYNWRDICFNCRDEHAAIYHTSWFSDKFVFCGKCHSEIEQRKQKKEGVVDITKELYSAFEQKEKDAKLCSNCLCATNPEYNRTIYWKNYAFCCGRSQYEFMKNAVVIPKGER